MPDAATIRSDFSRYAAMIRTAIGTSADATGFVPESETADSVQVERGVAFPAMLLDPASPMRSTSAVDRLIVLSSRDSLTRIGVVDRLGHERRLYRPVLGYSWLQAFTAGYETLPRGEFGRWEEATRAWCDDLEARLGEFDWPAGPIPASLGDAAAEACWTGLALRVAGKLFIRDAWTDLAGDVFGKLVKRQADGGAFLAAGGSDNPETHWYHELVILHAAASYAVQAEDRTLAAAVSRATQFHLQNTQPDHATNQPWGLFAFLWDARTRTIADGMLHGLEIEAKSQSESGRLPGLTLMLLADALYCLILFGIDS